MILLVYLARVVPMEDRTQTENAMKTKFTRTGDCFVFYNYTVPVAFFVVLVFVSLLKCRFT